MTTPTAATVRLPASAAARKLPVAWTTVRAT
jgi:hypothetical protein